MSSRTHSRTLGYAVLALAVALTAAACGQGDDTGDAPSPASTVSTPPPTASPTLPEETPPDTPPATEPGSAEAVTIRVADGEVEDGRRTIEASLGDRIRVRVEADVEDEVHVHGYDLFAAVAPDAPAELDFTAEAPGQFEIELEDAGLVVAELQVRS